MQYIINAIEWLLIILIYNSRWGIKILYKERKKGERGKGYNRYI